MIAINNKRYWLNHMCFAGEQLQFFDFLLMKSDCCEISMLRQFDENDSGSLELDEFLILLVKAGVPGSQWEMVVLLLNFMRVHGDFTKKHGIYMD